jgi:hypothetical protein
MKQFSLMIKNIIPLLFIIFSLACTPKKSVEQPVADADGWISLISEDLAQWNAIGEVESTVQDGVLTISAVANDQSAVLISNADYDNFRLEFDFKIDDPETRLVFRFQDKVRTVIQNAGYLVSTDFNPDQQHPVGSILNTARATVLEDARPDDWNSMAIEGNDTHLIVYLNQQLVSEVNDKRFSKGKIALQTPKSTGKTASYRNMRIKQLVTTPVVSELVEDRFRNDTSREWESMFDGETLTGWNPVGDGSWEVKDSAIHGYSGVEGGFLVSEQAYKDFYLKTKFKIIKEDNSGIFIRKSPDSTAITITDAIECNIYDHNGPSHAYSTGSIATHARAWYEMIDYQDWNEMEIFAKDEQIVMFVNGTKSSESYLPSKFAKAGNICLQGGIKVFAPDKGPSNVYFKEVMIKSFD